MPSLMYGFNVPSLATATDPQSVNALRLISINADSPNLTYTLTRQPDLDPIDELNKKPAPNCL